MSLDELALQRRLLDERLSYAYQLGMGHLISSIAEAQDYLSYIIVDRTSK